MLLDPRDFRRMHLRLGAVAALALALFVLASGARADEDQSSALAFLTASPPSVALTPVSRHVIRRSAVRTLDRTTRLHPDGGTVLTRLVTASAHRHGVPVRIAHAIVKVESNYRCGARSYANARGIMQVLPATARGVGIGGNLYNCATGLEAGMRYLKQIVVRHGTGCAALGLYERGAYARPICTAYGRKAVRLAWS